MRNGMTWGAGALAVGITAAVAAVPPDKPPIAATERVLVRFAPGVGGAKAALMMKSGAPDARIHHWFDWLDTAAVSLPADAARRLAKRPDVLLVEPDPLRYPYVQSTPAGVTAVQAPLLWAAAATGSDVLVCVIDSGLAIGHEDFDAAALTGGYSSDSGNFPWDSDACGHGTHVAGTIAAANNTLGVVGVAHSASLYVVRVFGGDANSCGVSFGSGILAAAQKCAEAGAAQGRRVVVNMSLGGPSFSSTENTGFTALLNTGAVLSIAAAGNAGDTSLSYPASYTSVISVGAVDSSKALAAFSQRNAEVELVAPGVSVNSTLQTGGYGLKSGTSMATPHVAGVAAAIWSRVPTRTAAELRAALAATAEDLGTAGRDDSFGFGLVRGKLALDQLLGEQVAPTVPGGFLARVTSTTAVQLSWTASTDSGGSGLAGYKLERCAGDACTSFVQVATPSASPHVDSGLASGTTFRWRIRAYDGAGNHSGWSTIASATPGSPDTQAPSNPAALTASVTTAGASNIRLAWTASEDFGGSGLAGYKIERCSGSTTCTNYAQIATATTNSFNSTGLVVGTVYRYRVRAYDGAGNHSGYAAPASAKAGTLTADTVAPSAVPTLSASATGSTTIALTWGAATDSGGSGLGPYRIERCLGASCTNFAQVGTATGTSWTSSNLAATTAYRYRVRAADKAGNLGAYSPIAVATTQVDTVAPAAVTALTATATGSTSIALSWPAATDSGGAGLGPYRIERCLGATCSNFTQVATAAGTSYTNSNLASTSSYRYRVRAADKAGNLGTYSPIALATTSVDTVAPSAVSALTATATGSSTIALSWPAATDSGGAGLGPYRIERCLGATCSNFTQVATAAGTSYTNSNLASTSVYRYRIRAADKAGNLGTYSPIALATTSVDTVAPSAVSALTATATGSSTIALSWPAATDSGGAGLGPYRIERCLGTGCNSFTQVATAAGTSYTNSNLASTSVYRYRVRAADKAGNLGAYSPIAVATTSVDTVAPSAVSALTATATGSSTIALSWPSATDSGGAGLGPYRIERCLGTGCSNFTQVATAAGTSYTNSNLASTSSYRYRVRAADKAGNLGAYSPIALATTSVDTVAPSAVSALTATATGSTTIALSWPAATDSGGAGLGPYRIERCLGTGCSSFTQVATAAGTSYTNSNLASTSSYRYRVRAADKAGNLGAYSPIAVATTSVDTVAPAAVTALTATATGSTTIALSWPAATDSGGAGLGPYRIERCLGTGCSSFTQVATAAGTSFTNSNLASTSVYRYRIRAADKAGNLGAYSPIAVATTSVDSVAPSAVAALTATATGSSTIALSWPAATDSGGAGLGPYRIERCLGISCSNFTQIATAAGTSYSNINLASNSSYRYRVRAADKAGNLGAYSPIATAKTNP